MSRPKVLFLGASPQQLAPLRYARNAGYGVVTCDNVPDNPGHALADRSYEVSVTEHEAVLDLARQEAVDGVVCYGSDVGASTAAFVADSMGLPGNPPEAVKTLTNKADFRRFQRAENLLAPWFYRFSPENGCTLEGLRESVSFPAIVKPVDSSGGKGITKLNGFASLGTALERALSFSQTGAAIVEELIPRRGYQVCGEGFLLDGRIVSCLFANEHFADGIHVPVGETFPSMFDQDLVEKATRVLQQIMDSLSMRMGAFNFDLLFTPTDEVFIVEIGPRSGGNRMPDAIRMGYGVDMIGGAVEVALGRRAELSGARPGFYATYSIHSREDGLLGEVRMDDFIRSKIVDQLMFVTEGDQVRRFDAGSHMVGNLILKFDSYEEMVGTIDEMDRHVQVLLR